MKNGKPTPSVKKKKYPFIAFRPSRELEARLRRLKKARKKERLSMSKIIEQCVLAELPKLEMPKVAQLLA